MFFHLTGAFSQDENCVSLIRLKAFPGPSCNSLIRLVISQRQHCVSPSDYFLRIMLSPPSDGVGSVAPSSQSPSRAQPNLHHLVQGSFSQNEVSDDRKTPPIPPTPTPKNQAREASVKDHWSLSPASRAQRGSPGPWAPLPACHPHWAAQHPLTPWPSIMGDL